VVVTLGAIRGNETLKNRKGLSPLANQLDEDFDAYFTGSGGEVGP